MSGDGPRRCRQPWAALRDTADPGIKHCDRCHSAVHRVRTRREFHLAIDAGLCVWFDRIDESRREAYVGGAGVPYDAGSQRLTWDPEVRPASCDPDPGALPTEPTGP